MFFYTVIDLEKLEGWLPQRDAQVREKVYSVLNGRILVLVLQKLPPEHLKEFTDRLSANASDPTLVDFLTEKVGESIKSDIQQAYVALIRELAPQLARLGD